MNNNALTNISANDVVWTNEHESIQITLQELSIVTARVEDLIRISVKKNLHVTYHTLIFARELLKRRIDYLRQVQSNTFTPSDRLTYPTYFLGEWLKFVTIKKKVLPGMCDYQCAQIFDSHTDPSNSKIFERDVFASYAFGPPFSSGPSESAPKVHCKNKWTDVYELKYLHLAIRNTIHDLIDDNYGLLKILLSEMSGLFLLRYKTDIGYTPGVSNNILKYYRHRFYISNNDFEKSKLMDK